ncbi:hypothetical protein [Devosia sp. DBB001]|nr:hypothetical protein [Devosia sp. DBB001]
MQEALAAAYREHWARLLALLTKRFGDIDLAEEALQEAFAAEHSPPWRPADWQVVAQLYALLEAFGPERGLELLADVEEQLAGHGPMHLARGEMLLRAGQSEAGKAAIGRALELSRKVAERRYLEARLREIG